MTWRVGFIQSTSEENLRWTISSPVSRKKVRCCWRLRREFEYGIKYARDGEYAKMTHVFSVHGDWSGPANLRMKKYESKWVELTHPYPKAIFKTMVMAKCLFMSWGWGKPLMTKKPSTKYLWHSNDFPCVLRGWARSEALFGDTLARRCKPLSCPGWITFSRSNELFQLQKDVDAKNIT